MARKRISEFRAKTLLYKTLGEIYNGIQVNDSYPLQENLDDSKKYIVKVDQGVKGRFKKGLVKLGLDFNQIPQAIKELTEKGYSQFLIEELFNYDPSDEKYLSITRAREGYIILFSEKGGVDIEQNQNSIQEIVLPYSSREFANGERIEKLEDNNSRFAEFTLSPTEGLTRTINANILEKLLSAFDKYYFSFLEINPFIIKESKLTILDAAVEVDSTASFFVNNAWTENDFTDTNNSKKTEEEINVKTLAAKSQAAFSLEVLNSDGAIFMMLSGGGASIVLADEAYNQGFGKQLANYGEYSGNPSAEETYLYAKNIISLLLKSKANKKILIIAGGVANFTDVRITFNGLIRALQEKSDKLQEQEVKVFVRRGGPYQTEGLKNMEEFLKKENMLGIVAGPEMILTDIVTQAIISLDL